MSNRQIFFKYLAIPAPPAGNIEIDKAEGIYLYSPDGKRYTDLVSGVSVSNLGHGHPRIVEAVKKQAELCMHLMVYGEFIINPQVKLAEKLCKHLPSSLDSVYLVNSGSEAIEGAFGGAEPGGCGTASFPDR